MLDGSMLMAFHASTILSHGPPAAHLGSHDSNDGTQGFSEGYITPPLIISVMSHPKAVSVIGFKNSGKTRVVEGLVSELTSRRNRVGTIKHTAEDVPLDTPGKDTMRHREAGSEATAILHEKSAAFFIDRYLTVQQAVSMLGTLDYLVIEGFKSLDVSVKIVVARSKHEAEELADGLEIAIVDMSKDEGGFDGGVPVVSPVDVGRLADIVEDRAFNLLPGLDCKGCGFPNCKSMGVALLGGEAEISRCVGYGSSFTLRIDGRDIPLGPFVQDILMSTTMGMVSSLKGVDKPYKVEMSFERGDDDD